MAEEHAQHGCVSRPNSVADSEEWEIVDDSHVEELLAILARIRVLIHLVFGLEESDPVSLGA